MEMLANQIYPMICIYIYKIKNSNLTIYHISGNPDNHKNKFYNCLIKLNNVSDLLSHGCIGVMDKTRSV